MIPISACDKRSPYWRIARSGNGDYTTRRTTIWSMKLLLALCTLVITAIAQTSVTVPVTLDHNRIIIDVRVPMPDGSTTRVRTWVDNGNPEMWITERMAKK